MESYKSTSNYSFTNQNLKYLELYKPPLTTETLDSDTRTFVVNAKYDRRPDLLAHDLYGNSRLWWVFAHYNRDKIKDPIMDFISGKTIQVPKQFKSSGNR